VAAPQAREALPAGALASPHEPHGARIDACGEVPSFHAIGRIAVRWSLTATASFAHAQCPLVSGVPSAYQTGISVHHEPTCSPTSQREPLRYRPHPGREQRQDRATRPAPPRDVRKTVYDHGATAHVALGTLLPMMSRPQAPSEHCQQGSIKFFDGGEWSRKRAGPTVSLAVTRAHPTDATRWPRQ
jgi:hypothetical protein